MLFYIWWLGLTAAALWVSIAAFMWALQAGQFAEQDRARYLPLRNEDLTPPGKDARSSGLSPEVYALMIVVGLGMISIAMTLLLVFTTPRG